MSVTLNYVGMVARDLNATLDFYRDLGLPIPDGAHLNAKSEPEEHVEVTVNGLRIAWDSETMIRQLNPDWTPPSGPGRVSVAFEADSPAGVDQACAHMAGRGHTVITPPYDAFWGQRYATLRDPDGNSVDVFAWLARA